MPRTRPAAACALPLPAATASADPAAVTAFLAAHCVTCYGADKPKGGFRVDAPVTVVEAENESGREPGIPPAAVASESIHVRPPCAPGLRPVGPFGAWAREAVANDAFDRPADLARRVVRRCDRRAEARATVWGAAGSAGQPAWEGNGSTEGGMMGRFRRSPQAARAATTAAAPTGDGSGRSVLAAAVVPW